MRNQQAGTERGSNRSRLDLPTAVSEFVAKAEARIPNFAVEIDAPDDQSAEWWLDVTCDGFHTSVSWRPSLGFGIFTSEAAYGDRPDELYRRATTAAHRVEQLCEQWKVSQFVAPLWLADLRNLIGASQTAIAAALFHNQPSVSRLEKREDVKLSTLVSHVQAMGGRIEMRVHFDELDAVIALPTASSTGRRRRRSSG